MTEKQATCADRVSEHLDDRLEDLQKLWKLWLSDCEASDEDLGNMYEYGLCFDYVAPDTFSDQHEGYFRYQLSYGGPSDEFRIYANKSIEHAWVVYRIEYWFLDWFDGASITLEGENLDFLKEIFQCLFVESETAQHQYERALEIYQGLLD